MHPGRQFECAVLGTKVTLHLGEKIVAGEEDLVERAFLECERIEREYSRFLEGNQLWVANQAVGEWQEISEEFADLVRVSLDVGQQTYGAFDLSVKSVLEGWGYGPGYSLMEGEPGHTGRVELDGRRLKISAPIELGGLGKGYAIDRMAEILASLPNVLIDAGGDLRAWGRASESEPWRVAFEDPRDPTKAIGSVDVDGFALASSSPARRAWRDRHHLVDPIHEKPAQDMIAVYTQAEMGLMADMFSTALFVMGFERAKALLPLLPIQAMLISPMRTVWKSEGFKGDLF